MSPGLVDQFPLIVTIETTLPEISERLALKVRVDVEEITKHMCDKRSAILATGLLAWPRGDGIQWNPPDDRCVAGLLTRDRECESALRGSLWSVIDKSKS